MVHTSNSDDRGRFSARRKTETVLRLLRGEDLELLSRELGVTAATLSAWRATSWPAARPPSRAGRPMTGMTRSPGCGPRSAS